MTATAGTADQPDTPHVVDGPQVLGSRHEVVQPATEGEVPPTGAAPPRRHGEGGETHLGGDALGELGVGGARVRTASGPTRETVGDHHTGKGNPRGGARHGEVSGEHHPVGVEPDLLDGHAVGRISRR